MELVSTYFPKLHTSQLEQLTQYEQLLRQWNQKINLISRKNEDEIIEQHILHSLSIARFINFQPKTSILDLGTGGGLPGIPLAIYYPDVSFHLIDSTQKKINAVVSMKNQLRLSNVSAEHGRVEKHRGEYDFVVTRAVAKTKQLVSWSRHLYSSVHHHQLSNGLIALKGGDLTDELAELNRDYSVHSIADDFKESFFETKKIVYVQMTE